MKKLNNTEPELKKKKKKKTLLIKIKGVFLNSHSQDLQIP